MTKEHSNLIKRIARLVREKNELQEYYENLLKENEQLTEQNNRFRDLIGRISPELLEKKMILNLKFFSPKE